MSDQMPSKRLFKLVTGPGEDVYRAGDLLDIAHAMADVEAELETAKALEEEAKWIIDNFPPDHLGSYTQVLRQKWVARRDAWLAASQERVRELEMRDEAWESTMREIANSGVEFEDERVGYVTVQIDRDIWLSLAALRGPSTAGAEGEQDLDREGGVQDRPTE